jgi:glycosyltransferase involved in cell wall biosynthesis
MKIVYLASASSVHTTRWTNALADRGHSISLLTLHEPSPELPLHRSIRVHKLSHRAPTGYFLNRLEARRTIRAIAPDLLHVHYATGYGTLGRLSGFQPTILSVWGSDVTEFARGSFARKRLLQKNLRYPALICATSNFLRRETENLVKPRHPVVVTPFGIDCREFHPRGEIKDPSTFIVGTVKTLSHGYGIDRLLQAFALFKEKAPPEVDCLLRIVGGGPDRASLEREARRLGISHITEFVGHVPASALPELLREFSIYVALSRTESFGVAVLEASASGIPAIVSDAGGLGEVVVDGLTGAIVPDGLPRVAADIMGRLLRDPEERLRMGTAGRNFVLEKYPLDKTIARMEQLYYETLNQPA